MYKVQVKKTIEVVREFPNLGERIRKAREGDNRPLSQICKQTGISRSYWYKLENEQVYSSVSEEVIRKIEEALKVNLGVTFDQP